MKTRIFVLILTLAVAALPLLAPAPAQAQVTKAWTGNCVDPQNPTVATLQGAECLVKNMLNIGVGIVGFSAFVMFIIGSFLLLTSGGNPKGTEAGQKTFTFAVVGVVVALFGAVAINFISNFTGVKTVEEFKLDVEQTN